MPGRLPDWLTDPALDAVCARLRDRLERAGLEPTGRVRVSLATRQERHAVSSLLGRTVTRDAVVVDLAALDQRLRERSGCGGLVEVLAARDDVPLRDRRAERDARRARREEPLGLARQLIDEPWADAWVAELRRTGLLSRAADPETVVRQAAAVVRALLEGSGHRSRVELAAHVVGDAHALDEDRILGRVVVRALAASQELPVPDSSAARWTMWDSFGVSPDAVSTTCLVLGIAGAGHSSTAARLRAAGEAGDPVHLTRWDLAHLDGLATPDRPVLVCENPRVLEGVAESYGGSVPVVCTSGEPNTVVAAVLASLADGARLRYHGDFDWPGVAIANRVTARFGAHPWLMSAGDYEDAVRADAPELAGRPVEPGWDHELGAAMRARGRALHEETVLPDILSALDGERRE